MTQHSFSGFVHLLGHDSVGHDQNDDGTDGDESIGADLYVQQDGDDCVGNELMRCVALR